MNAEATPSPPSGMDGPGTGGLGVNQPSVSPQDLTGDHLLAGAPRAQTQYAAVPVPELGGIPLLAKLGQGGMGAVYYGMHPRLDIEVAVKVLPFHLAGLHPDLVQRFFREAKVAAQVRSPHLVGVTDVNQQGALYYIVMEFVRGQSAGTLVRETREAKRPPMSEADALTIVTAATHGLCAAHEAGVIHRDIKPDNVMIPQRRNGGFDFAKAKLCDLGLARSEDMDKSLTGSYSSMGTPGFMAPEQGLDARTAGKPADVFSMGATLYALLAGHAPFHGSSVMKVMMDTAQQPHRPIRELRPDVSPTTEALLQRCLAKDPSQRYTDGHALLTALTACAAFPEELEETMRVPQAKAAAAPAPPVQTPVPATAAPATPAPVSERPSGAPPHVSVHPYAHPSAQPSSHAYAQHPSGAVPVPTPLPPPAPRASGKGWLVAALLFLALLGGGAFVGWRQWSEQQAQRAAARAKALEKQAAAGAALEAWDLARERLRQTAQDAGTPGALVWKRLEAKSMRESLRADLRRSASLGASLLTEGDHERAEGCFAEVEKGVQPGLDLAKKAGDLLAVLKPLYAGLEAARKEDEGFYAPLLNRAKDVEAGLEGETWDGVSERAAALDDALRIARQALAARRKVEPARAAAAPWSDKAALKPTWTKAGEAEAAAAEAARAGDWAKAQENFQAAADAYAGMPALADKLGADAVKLAEERLKEGNYIALQQALKDAEDLRPNDPALNGIRARLAEMRKEERKAAVNKLFTARTEELAGVVDLLREGAAEGDAAAQTALGDAYFFGLGGTRNFLKASEWYRKAAEGGYARAMHNLGELYLYGYGRPRDEPEAVRWFDQGASAGDPACVFRAGQCRWAGIGTPKDEKRGRAMVKKALDQGLLAQAEQSPRVALLAGMYYAYDYFDIKNFPQARTWLQRSAGHPRADFLLGQLYVTDKLPGADAKDGIPLLERTAVLGDADAMTALADYLIVGTGAPLNEKDALAWYEKSADLGNTLAMYRLGERCERRQEFTDGYAWYRKAAEAGHAASMARVAFAHDFGRGARKDDAEAAAWFRKAADAGDASAAFGLGRLYYEGRNFPKNEGQAFRLFTQSAEGGNMDGMASVSVCYRLGMGTEKDFAKALEWARKAADLGSNHAMLSLGLQYEDGLGVNRDYAQARAWYEKSSQAGNVTAYSRLALLYSSGRGVARDEARATQLFKTAAEMGDGYAASAYGRRLLDGQVVPKDDAEAVRWFEKASELGDAYGMCMLGACYEEGRGCVKSLERAAQWYQKAADGGNVYSHFNLGRLYRSGSGVLRDPAQAIKHFRAAADEESLASCNIAEMYRLGDGVPKDPSQSAYWYRKAAEMGNKHAMFYIGLACHSGDGVTQDYAQAVQWYSKVGEDSAALYNLGLLYAGGLGTARDIAKAAECYRRAAELGQVEAMFNLSMLLVNGDGIARDNETAFTWVSKSAEKGYVPAMAQLGLFYANGQGTRKDFDRAAEWLQKGANGGSDIAMYNLGVLYHNGWSVAKDLGQAVYWYRKAANLGNADAINIMKALGQQ